MSVSLELIQEEKNRFKIHCSDEYILKIHK